jgi:hypothetical protein
VTGTDWLLAGIYMAALVGGSLCMSALARRSLIKLKEKGH